MVGALRQQSMATGSNVNSFAIVPAAGVSQRMGRPKLLLPWAGQRVIDVVLNAWQQSQVTRTIVIAHAKDSEVLAACQSAGVEVVALPTRTKDMKATIKIGLSHIEQTESPQPDDAWLVAPADLPNLSSPAIDHVLQAFQSGPPISIVPVHEGRHGHPALLPWSMVPKFNNLSNHEGLNTLLRGDGVCQLECPGKIWAGTDVNTPEEYQHLLALEKKTTRQVNQNR